MLLERQLIMDSSNIIPEKGCVVEEVKGKPIEFCETFMHHVHTTIEQSNYIYPPSHTYSYSYK